MALHGRRAADGIVVTFFFTFALSFFIDGVAKVLFGTDVHAAPALWNGGSLTVLGGPHIEPAGVLVLACALIIGSAFGLYIRYTLGGKAMEACGEKTRSARASRASTPAGTGGSIFVGTAVIAAVFGIVESPITGYTYLSGATISLTGFKIDYIVMNNQSSASESELIARKCILSDHAQFIVGPESGADTEAALPIAIAYHTILISLSSGWQTNGYPASRAKSWGSGSTTASTHSGAALQR